MRPIHVPLAVAGGAAGPDAPVRRPVPDVRRVAFATVALATVVIAAYHSDQINRDYRFDGDLTLQRSMAPPTAFSGATIDKVQGLV
jgi:hypothetical protein